MISVERKCRKCGNVLEAGRNWGFSYSRYGNYICSPCSSKYNLTIRPRFLKKCLSCQAEFETVHQKVKFCSDQCRALLKKGIKRPEVSQKLGQFYTEHPGYLKGTENPGRFQEGHAVKPEWTEANRNWHLGRSLSEETKARVSANTVMFFFEHPEVREFLSTNQRGSRHWNWKGGKTEAIHLLRHSTEYEEWRLAVYARDGWSCRMCGSKEQIIAHHILPFRDYPLIRFSVDNGVTLCRACHKLLHSEVGVSTRFRPAKAVTVCV